MRKKYNVTLEQAKGIREVIKEYEKTSSFRKLQAVMLIGENESVKEVAKITLYSEKWVYKLVKEFCVEGFDEFVKDGRGGSHHKNLTDEQENGIINKFRKKAESGQVVSLIHMKKEYDKVRGKESANSTFYAFLQRKQWRRIMPRGAHPKKASDEVIEASKKLTFS